MFNPWIAWKYASEFTRKSDVLEFKFDDEVPYTKYTRGSLVSFTSTYPFSCAEFVVILVGELVSTSASSSLFDELSLSVRKDRTDPDSMSPLLSSPHALK